MPNYLNDENFTPKEAKKFKLADFDTAFTDGMTDEDNALEKRKENTQDIAKLQEKMFAKGTKGLLLIFQAMDAAGKDSTIKHVMTGVNPQGCRVFGFKQPSKKELQHDFLWRCYRRMPERGHIGIFNRSYYEEVLVCKVHPKYVLGQGIGDLEEKDINKDFWNNRYESINDFEKHISQNGYKVIKFFLNVSKEEQKNRFQRRINLERKNWKFSFGDIQERKLWDQYMKAYEEMIQATHKPHAPWYVIPADNKWFMRYAVSEIIKDTMDDMVLSYPMMSEKAQKELNMGKEELEKES